MWMLIKVQNRLVVLPQRFCLCPFVDGMSSVKTLNTHVASTRPNTSVDMMMAAPFGVCGLAMYASTLATVTYEPVGVPPDMLPDRQQALGIPVIMMRSLLQ